MNEVHENHYLRKMFKRISRFLIRLLWSKERIMEVYLNIAETGKEIFRA